jgi:hypothetical protein
MRGVEGEGMKRVKMVELDTERFLRCEDNDFSLFFPFGVYISQSWYDFDMMTVYSQEGGGVYYCVRYVKVSCSLLSEVVTHGARR